MIHIRLLENRSFSSSLLPLLLWLALLLPFFFPHFPPSIYSHPSLQHSFSCSLGWAHYVAKASELWIFLAATSQVLELQGCTIPSSLCALFSLGLTLSLMFLRFIHGVACFSVFKIAIYILHHTHTHMHTHHLIRNDPFISQLIRFPL